MKSEEFLFFEIVNTIEGRHYYLCDFYRLSATDGKVNFRVVVEMDNVEHIVELEYSNAGGWNISKWPDELSNELKIYLPAVIEQHCL